MWRVIPGTDPRNDIRGETPGLECVTCDVV